MPLQSRIDTPSAFHHIIARRIRADTPDDTVDRDNLVERLETVFEQTRAVCYIIYLHSSCE